MRAEALSLITALPAVFGHANDAETRPVEQRFRHLPERLIVVHDQQRPLFPADVELRFRKASRPVRDHPSLARKS
jgi:hypothetical protein